MLYAIDTQVVIEWFARAMESIRDHPKRNAADLARFAEVTPQAVNGWLRTGRISKANLAKAAVYFDRTPPFGSLKLGTYITPPTADQSLDLDVVVTLQAEEGQPMGWNWPFPSVDRRRFDALTATERNEIQELLLQAILVYEAARHGSGRHVRPRITFETRDAALPAAPPPSSNAPEKAAPSRGTRHKVK